MNNFLILFRGREGTSPVVRTLDRFPQVSIVRHYNDTGWEPFDRHNCGPMTLSDLERCLEYIYGSDHVDMEQLNSIYLKTARNPLKAIEPRTAVGFKMRFVSPEYAPGDAAGHHVQFRNMMVNVLRKNNVVVFLAVRQDVLRWGLSKYHGDGTGKEGHLQFKLAKGEIRRDQIPKIHVDCDKLDKLIADYEANHAAMKELMADLQAAGVRVSALRYEDLLQDKTAFFRGILDGLAITISEEVLNAVISQGMYYEKVHSDRISDFVINYEEVLGRFDKRFISW